MHTRFNIVTTLINCRNLQLSILTLLFSISAFAQNSYMKTFGTNDSEYGTAICNAPDSGIVFCQLAYQASPEIPIGLVKVNKSGQMEWYKIISPRLGNVAKKYSTTITVM
ncbi:MAG: hypothetical protein IPP51_11855 [Bacteroidetes bacterium]|nr:hypothetical protein [Bacteroidota bacterium]